jgi:hypothetical protein
MFAEAVQEFRRQHKGVDPELIWVTRRALVVLTAQADWPGLTLPVRFCNEPPPFVAPGAGRALVLWLKELPGTRPGVVATETDSLGA